MPFNVLDPSTAAVAPSTTAGAPLTSTGETLSSIQAELFAQLGNRDDIGGQTGTRITGWINRAYRQMAGMIPIKETFGSLSLSLVGPNNLNVTQPFYAIPVQVAFIKKLSVQDSDDYIIWQGRELAMIDEDQYRMLPTLTDEPTSYFRYRRMVVIWPDPLNARTAALDFKVRPDDLVNATDSPLFPIEFHDPLILYSRVVALRALQNWTDAAAANNDFLAALRPLTDTDAEERQAAHSRVQPVRRTSGLYKSRGISPWNRQDR